MDKIAVMMSIVSNTRVDIVARGVIKACLELGHDPAEKIAVFRIPGAWEEEGFKILEKYGVEYFDRSVSMHEAAKRAVEKIGTGRRRPPTAAAPVRRGARALEEVDLERRGRGALMLIDQDTTFIVQGITGREAVNLTRECLDYGSKVVGGVTPGRRGREVHGVPVYDSVAQLCDELGYVPDGSVVTVPPAFTRDAVFEAIEAGVKIDRDRHRAHPALRRRPDGGARQPARRAHHRPELPRDHPPRRGEDGRHRRPRARTPQKAYQPGSRRL